MNLDFKKTVHRVTFEGGEYDVRCPSIYELRNFVKANDGTDNVQQFDKTVEFLEHLGLPQSVSKQLELSQLEQIMELFNSKKK
jgi:hypothetical protein